MGWLVYVLPYARESNLFPLSCPNGESAEEMTARVDCVIGDVGSLYIHIEARGGVNFVSPRFVNITGNGRRKVRGREML